MFEWLEKELQSIHTPKFHIIGGPLSEEQRLLVDNSPLAVPPSYKNFVIRFGHAQLYRQGNLYLVQVFSVPVDAESAQGEALLNFGRTDLGFAYFKMSQLVKDAETPIFEWTGKETKLRRTANGFEEWIKNKCSAARRMFSKKRWSGILAGPQPFTPHEKAVVEARKEFHWQVIGIAKNGDLQFKVHNASQMILPYLSIGVHGKHGEVQGGVWLPVSHIAPGTTAIVEKDCYKDVLAPQDVETFELPEPGPEDRKVYWEFRPL